ncbi:MAG: dienelactone hydrolase family protein [Pyrinomonadaceae bacterium]|nr:dienelactone hydrolase family protein [Pyrinomonadaceae bacterium]MCX7639855.1 dienelactone hydrolase family protein [Pyrinomonadaceae bacterium]MDW8304027.1 dienelactone hydrolase family protein [Acidobacteriota bacterium]
MKSETFEFDTANGKTTAYVALPDVETDKALILIHEWWGLNDHIKDVANRYAEEGFIVIAPDLFRGKVTADPTEASKLMHGLAIEDGLDTIKNAIQSAKAKYNVKSFGITGFCMGGTFALRAACELEDLRASAPFYGDIPEEEVLKKLKIPTMFISGKRDQWITPEKVSVMEQIASKHNLPLESIKYDADHAFFNNTRPEVYDEASARDAWEKVLKFFKERLS